MNFMNTTKYLILFLFIPLSVFGRINVKNGIFQISYTDIVVPGGSNDLSITRTYNSKSSYKGYFGMGWGSYYETFLVVSPDGSVVIHEHGSGAKTRFTPKSKAVDGMSSARKIVAAMREKSSGTMTEAVAKNWVDKFAKDATLRQAYARRYNVSAELPSGTKLYSTQRGPQELVATARGFERRYNDGKVEVFNKQGKMTQVRDNRGYRITLNHEKGAGRLKSIKDNKGKQLFFDWYESSGLVRNIWSTGGKKSGSSYKYDGEDLIESTDTSGNVYKYTYENHNMTSIAYSDGTTMKIKYDPNTQFAVEHTDRNGRVTSYKYESNPENSDLHYWTTVTRRIPVPTGAPKGTKERVETNRYEYEIKIRPDGSRYTHRIAATIRGISTETIYSECCNLPLQITRGKEVTKFKYDDNGLLETKESSTGERVSLEYHKKFKKITKVVNRNGWTKLDYDEKDGTLSRGTNSEGQSVTLVHDRKKRIKRLIASNSKTKEKAVLSFEYNALDKPIEIKLEGAGAINLRYSNSGEVKKVDSSGGPQMVAKVRNSFDSLLKIVKPAGVNLNI